MSTRQPSPADILADRANIKLREVARNFPHYRPRLTEKQLKHRMQYVRRVTKHGGLSLDGAERLANLLNCSVTVFLHGYEAYQKYQQALKGVAGANGKTLSEAPVSSNDGVPPSLRSKRHRRGVPILTIEYLNIQTFKVSATQKGIPMTLTIEVAPEVESRLRDRAAREGVPLESLATDAFLRGLDDLESEEAQDLADAEEARRIMAQSDPSQRRTLKDLKAALGR